MSHKGGYPTPWWAQARDCEALHGRAFAEATWGSWYYADDGSGDEIPPEIASRLKALEAKTNHLYALAAMRQAEKQEASPIKRGGKRLWKPADGLANRET